MSPVTGLAPDPGTTVTVLLRPGDGGALGVARVAGGFRWAPPGPAWIAVEGGAGALELDGRRAEVAGRDDVFDGPGWSVLAGPAAEVRLAGDLRAALAWRAGGEVAARVIAPDDVEVALRGGTTDRRVVRTAVADGPLRCGETLNDPGCWSSWPPHRHPEEEVYLYRCHPAHGFGIQLRTGPAENPEAGCGIVVRDGDVQRITAGWHPVVAAPGIRLGYLWVLAAGDGEVATETDGRFRGDDGA